MRAVILLLCCLIFSGYTGKIRKELKGSGILRTEERVVKEFSALKVSRNIHVFLSQGTRASVRIETDDNLISYVTTTVNGNTLKISLSNQIEAKNAVIRAYVTLPELRSAEATTSAVIEGRGRWNADKINLEASTSARIKLQLNAASVKTEICTSAHVELSGEATQLTGSFSTSGQLAAEHFNIRFAKVDGSTSGLAELSVSEQLSYSLSTSAALGYRGSPRITKASLSTGGAAYRR